MEDHEWPRSPDGDVPRSFSRDLDAAGRDRAAERRDLEAERRDEDPADGPWSGAGRHSRDREASARDREAAAADRRAASREMIDEESDELTGVMRRGVGLAAIRRELARCEREDDPLVVAYVDVVGLKKVNDQIGHRAGDRLLEEVARNISEGLRGYDIVVRVGGDEFVCGLARQRLESARQRFDQIGVRLREQDTDARITVGLAERRKGDTLEMLVDRADAAMLDERR